MVLLDKQQSARPTEGGLVSLLGFRVEVTSDDIAVEIVEVYRADENPVILYEDEDGSSMVVGFCREDLQPTMRKLQHMGETDPEMLQSILEIICLGVSAGMEW